MAARPEGQRCENCRYFATSARAGIHICRRYPPAFLPNEGTTFCAWASVEPNKWCGEYAPANPETVTEGAMTMARLVLLGDLTAARALADKLRE